MSKAYREELIGKKVRVEKTGIIGTIIDETKNTITIETTKESKRVDKKNHDFIITSAQGEISIRGSEIIARPEDRIKHNW